MSELLNCPFCGSIPKISNIGDGWWEIFCDNIECGCPDFSEQPKEEVIRLWNRRDNNE